MAIVSTPSTLPQPIRELLDRVRGLIQRYILLQALVLAVSLGLVGFWLAGLVDYFPVMMGASESPRWARALMLALLLAGIFWVIFRFGWQKWWVPWHDNSVALLLERRFPSLQHALITTLQAHQATKDDDATQAVRDPALLAQTRQDALDAIAQVDPDDVFRWEPLRRQLGFLGGMLGLSIVLALWQPTWTYHWSKRLFALSNAAWPRQCRLDVEGIEIDIPHFLGEDQGARYLRPFRDGVATLPRGHSGRLVVSADLLAKKVPELCMLSYRSLDGRQGRASLRRLAPSDERRLPFVLEGPPLEMMDQGLAMTLQGGDARIAGLRLDVVDPPQVLDLKLVVKYPSYLRRNPSSTWIDETIEYRTGMRLPQGTDVTFVGRANQTLDRCDYKWTSTDREGVTRSDQASVEGEGELFRVPIGKLSANAMFEVRLWEGQGHCSTKIQQYFLSVLADEPPRVDLKLDGIGTAITENALLPVAANVNDDHGIAASWLEVQTNPSTTWKRDATLERDGQIRDAIDLRDLRDSKQLQLTAGESVTLLLLAKDYFDLNEEPRLGRASPLQLSVVTPNQLLVLLERRELAMRGRLELAIGELNQLRELLIKIRQTNRTTKAADGSAPTNENETATELSQDKLQLPRAQQATAQVEKSSGELAGIELEIGQIYRELINNRIDSQDRQDRLENRVRLPLQKVRLGSLNELQQRVIKLEKALVVGPTEDSTVGAAIDSLSETLAGLEDILKAMIDIQDFNEVVDMVRSMVEEQGKIIDRTKAEQKQRLLDQFKF